MLQLEVNKLTEETNLMKARISVEDAMLTFRSFLGIREEEEIEVVPHDSVPDLKCLWTRHWNRPIFTVRKSRPTGGCSWRVVASWPLLVPVGD